MAPVLPPVSPSSPGVGQYAVPIFVVLPPTTTPPSIDRENRSGFSVLHENRKNETMKTTGEHLAVVFPVVGSTSTTLLQIPGADLAKWSAFLHQRARWEEQDYLPWEQAW